MLLSIIVTHYKTPAILKLCLKTLKKSCYGLEHEIILVDSEAESKTEEMVRHEFPEIKLISFKKNVGYAKLVNQGLKESSGEFILIINADIIIPQDTSLKNLIDFLKAHPKVGMVGPQLLNFDGSLQFSAFRFYTPWTIVCRRTWLGKTPWGKKELDRFLLKSQLTTYNLQPKREGIEVDWLMGSCLMVKKEAVEKVGLLDERFFMYFEDVDWAKRFWENEYKVVYLPDCQIYHYHYKASDKGRGIFDLLLNKQTRIHLISAIKYFWKYRGRKEGTKKSPFPPSPAE